MLRHGVKIFFLLLANLRVEKYIMSIKQNASHPARGDASGAHMEEESIEDL